MSKNFLLISFLFLNAKVFSTPDSWTQKSSMPAAPRIGAFAFALHGYGYVGTGLDSSGHLLNDFWKYDSSNDSWMQVADFAGSARRNATAFVTDTFAYAGTGYDSAGLTKDFYRYDPDFNSWQRIADLDSLGAVYPRRDAASFNLGNKGYVVGGYDGSTFYSKDTWEYDGSLDTVWNEMTPFPAAGRRWAVAFGLSGFGFVGMGYNYSQEYFSDLWKFDNTSNTWTQMADFPGSERGNAVCFVTGPFAYAGTGFDGNLQNDFYRYDYASNAWNPVAPYAGTPVTGASGFSFGGKGYVFGGSDSLGYKNELWEYTPGNVISVPEIQEDNSAVYPNPAADKIAFRVPLKDSGSQLQLKIFNSAGEIIFTQSVSSPEKYTDVKNLPRGLYYFSLESVSGNQTRVTGKLVLQ